MTVRETYGVFFDMRGLLGEKGRLSGAMVVVLALASIAAVTIVYVSYKTGPGENGENKTPGEDNEKFTDQDSYIFLEIWCHKDGKIIEEKENMVRSFVFIDFATYLFNEETGVLRTGYFEMPDNFKVAVGVGHSLGGDAGGGVASTIWWVSSIPSEDVGGSNLSITNLDANGSVSLTYRGENIILRSGEEWENVTTGIEEVSLELSEDYLMEYETTVTIKNYGFQDKDKIELVRP